MGFDDHDITYRRKGGRFDNVITHAASLEKNQFLAKMIENKKHY